MTPDKASNEQVNCTRILIPLVTGGQYENRPFRKMITRLKDSLRVYRTMCESLGLSLGRLYTRSNISVLLYFF